VSSAHKPDGLGKIKDLGHKRESDHQDLKVMEVLKNCKERYRGSLRVAKRDKKVVRNDKEALKKDEVFTEVLKIDTL
jgi:hypothetical protein